MPDTSLPHFQKESSVSANGHSRPLRPGRGPRVAGTRPCAPARVTAWTPGGARRPRRASPPCAWGSAREEMWPAAQRRHGSWRCTVSVPGEPSQRVRHAPRPWNGRRGRRASRARLACSVAEGGVFLAARSRPPPSAAHAPSWDSAPMGCCRLFLPDPQGRVRSTLCTLSGVCSFPFASHLPSLPFPAPSSLRPASSRGYGHSRTLPELFAK